MEGWGILRKTFLNYYTYGKKGERYEKMKNSYKKILSLIVVFLILIQTIIPSMAIEKEENNSKEDNETKATEII